MFKRILVPLDGSSFGEAGLRPATALVRRTGGELRLLSVQEPDWDPRRRALAHGFRRWREEYLSKLARGFSDPRVSTVVRDGRAEDEILLEVESWGADVLVMSTHGRGAISRAWLGGVADHCMRRSRVPLLLTRARPGELQRGSTFAPSRLVVPLDCSELAEQALPWALSLAQSFCATITLLCVVADAGQSSSRIRLDAAPGGGRPPEPGAARAYLATVAERARAAGVAVSVEQIVADHVAQAIVARAAAELVVMASHSRTPSQRALLGSVTDKVVRGTRGDVLVIPSACQADAERPAAALESAQSMGRAVSLVG